MTENIVQKIIIRHASGSKANSIQEFPLDGRKELRLGRDPSCDIIFDSVRDDTVSRSHAIIRIDSEAKSGFSIEDLGSQNGTFLNKKRIEGKTEILPDDILALGLNGPSLIFDISPRPANLVARTKIVDIAPPSATRVVNAADVANAAKTAVDTKTSGGATTQTAALQSGAKESIGRNTMLHELDKVRDEAKKDRNAAGQKWFMALAGVIALALIGGGSLLWKQSRDEKIQEGALRQARLEVVRVEREAETQSREAIETIHKQIGQSALDIVRQYGPATAMIEIHWRLFDEATGRGVFHKTTSQKGKLYKVFARFRGGEVVPILTLDDENRTNPFVGGDIAGTAFGVSEQGFLLTNRHLAAAWKEKYFDEAEDVLLVDCYQKPKKKPCTKTVVKTDNDMFKDVNKWVPESGWLLFDPSSYDIVGGNIPDNTKTFQHSFYGRNESFKVTFANTRLAMNATLVRVSDENDVALLKVESPEKINTVKLAQKNFVLAAGEKITVLGYPAISLKTIAVSEKFSDSQLKQTNSLVPQPYVTEGIVAIVSNRILAKDGVTMYAPEGDMMQLTINSTGPGNSGGPVFNSFGEVIGIFSRAYRSGFASSSGAVPISVGQDLMR